jgi:hypothetical protein
LVRVAEREQAQDGSLAIGQRVGFGALAFLGIDGDHARAETRMNVATACGDFADGSDDVGVGCFFEDVAGGAGSERLAHVAGVVLHREHEHLRLGRVLQHIGDGLDTALPRHDDIHQDDVGLLGPRLEDGLLRVTGFADYLDPLFGVEHVPEPAPDNSVVIDDQDADHGRGTSPASVVPAPGRDSIFSLPPKSANRSRIPSRPSPS